MAYKFQLGDARLGGAVESTGQLKGTSLDAGDGNLTNVGDINADSISVDDAATGLNIDGSGANSGQFQITLADNQTQALVIVEGSNQYMSFKTTNDSEEVQVGNGSDVIHLNLINASSTIKIDDTTILDAAGAAKVKSAVAGAGLAESSGVLSVDIDELGDMTATLHQTEDHFMVSDGGTEKKITFSNLEDGIFANISGDATVAAGGALTIAAGAVDNDMLAGSIANAKLSNSAITVAGNSISLGGSLAAATLAGSLALDDIGVPDASVDLNSQKIVNLLTPTGANDAANKAYVDSVAQGLTVKDAVVAATTGNGTLASAFANGQTVDGVTLATGDRILLKDQTAASENGIYTVNASGAPTRAVDFDADADVAKGAFVFVREGTVNADNGFVLTTDADITVGTTALAFTQFSGAGQITADEGLNKSANNIFLALDTLGTAKTSLAQADLFAISDSADSDDTKKITFSNLEDAIFGNVSGDATIAAGGALTIGTGAIESGMLNDNVISGQTELASDGLAAEDELMISDGGSLKKIGIDNLFKDGPGVLATESVTVADDHIMFLDGGATGDAKIESIADLVAEMAGSGLTASNGQLSTQANAVVLKDDTDTLAQGVNYLANLSGAEVVNLPNVPSVGDSVKVKAPANCSSTNTLTIQRTNTDHTIDGDASIVLQSPHAAVELIYVVSNVWKVF